MSRKFFVGCFVMLLTGFVFLVGCKIETVGDPDKPIKIEAHVTVDIRKLKDTATDIEDEVSGQKPDKTPKDTSMNIIDKMLGVQEAYAAKMNLKYATPETDAAIASRKARFQDLKDLKKKGLAGEANTGFVVYISGGAAVQAMVDAENHDRDVIYNAIVQQNGMPPQEINTVRKTFAEVHRNKAKTGYHIQLESGEWIVK